jgi:hypothetical protein
MVKRITLKKVIEPSGCSFDTSGAAIVDNEPDYELESEDEDEDEADSDEALGGVIDYDSCATTDTEDAYENTQESTCSFVPCSINFKEYEGEDELEEETDFRPIEKKCKQIVK